MKRQKIITTYCLKDFRTFYSIRKKKTNEKTLLLQTNWFQSTKKKKKKKKKVWSSNGHSFLIAKLSQ